MKKIIILILLMSSFLSFGQRGKIDSLKNDLKKIEAMLPSFTRDTLSSIKIKKLMYYYTFFNTDSSLFYTNKLLGISQKRNIETDIIHCYNYFGYLYGLDGNYFMAAQNYYKALGMAEKSKNEKRILDSKLYLTEAYIGLEDFDKAVKYGKESLILAKKMKTFNEIMSSLNNLGTVFLYQKKYKEAQRTFEELNVLAIKRKDADYTPISYYSLGQTELNLQNYDKAFQFLNQELAYYEPKTMRYATSKVYISEVLVAQKKYDLAIPEILSAQKIIMKEGGDDVLKLSYKLLYESYKAKGNPAEALKYHEKFMTMKDSLSTESTQSRIRSLQFEYDNTLKESQLQKKNIELLEEKTQKQQISQTRNLFLLGGLLALILAGVLFWNNRKLNTQNKLIESQKTQIMLAQEQLENANQNLEFKVSQRTQELASANDELIHKNEEIKTALFTGQSIERKRVASELHDNVSSLLSAVNMTMQAISGKALSDTDQKIYQNVREMIKSAYSEVRNISHNIMPAGLEKDGLLKTVEQLLEKINVNKQLSFSIVTTGIYTRFPVQIELNVYSLILELINNIIKHSEASIATISISQKDNILSLEVEDNGIGFDIKNSSLGNGIANIQSRVDALNGSFKYESEKLQGCLFEINIPLSSY
jgi:signal transduction histidine kinase